MTKLIQEEASITIGKNLSPTSAISFKWRVKY